MDKLPRIIGKAPSELTHEELRSKLLIERERIRRTLTYFQQRFTRKGSRSKASPSVKLSTKIKELGLTPQELIKGLEILKKQKLEEEGK